MTLHKNRTQSDSDFALDFSRDSSNAHFGSLRGKQPQSWGMTVPDLPGSAAILAASGAGETPALPGKACSEVRYGAFLCKMSIAEETDMVIVS